MITVYALASTGCGGGGGGNSSTGSSMISGVAAAGSPIVGKVYLKDSSSPATIKEIDIASDGSFSFDVTKMTAPYYLKAQGTVQANSYTLYSIALASGTANINPLTNVIIAAAAGIPDPALVYNQAVNIRQVFIDASIASMQQTLQSRLEKFNAEGVNPLSGRIKADHSGLDAFFDSTSIGIDLNSGDVTVTDTGKDEIISIGSINTIGGFLPFSHEPCSSTNGDAITVEKVRGPSANIVPGGVYEVSGTYTLNSRDSAMISASNKGGSDGEGQQKVISRGQGSYILIFTVKAVQPGYEKVLDVGFYPSGGGSQFYYCNDIYLN
jgi:hypothetical protein